MQSRKKVLFREIQKSYIVLLVLIAILFTVSASVAMRQSSIRAANESNEKILHVTADLYEEQIFFPLARLYNQFVNDLQGYGVLPDTAGFFKKGQTVGPMDVYRISRYLKDSLLQYSFLSGIHFYSQTFNRMISTQYGYKSGREAVEILRALCIDLSDLPQSKLPALSEPFVFAGASHINFIYPGSFGEKEQAYTGYIIFTLDCADIADIINISSNETVFIVDSSNTILVHPDAALIGTHAEASVIQSGKDPVIRGNTVQTFVYSELLELYFVTERTTRDLTAHSAELFFELLIIAAAVTFLGWWISNFLSRRLAFPLERIMNRISSVTSKSNLTLYDFEEAVETVCRKFQTLEQFTQMNQEVLKSSLLFSMYFQEHNQSVRKSYCLEYLGLHPNARHYIPAIIQMQLHDEESYEEQQLRLFQLKMYYESAASSIIVGETDSGILALLAEDVPYEDLCHLLEEDICNEQLRVFVGDPLKSFDAVSDCFKELRQIMKYTYFEPNVRMWHLRNISLCEHLAHTPDFSFFSSALRNGKFEECCTFIANVIEAIRTERVAYDAAQDILLQIVQVFAQAAQGYSIDTERVERLVKAQTVLDFEFEFSVLLRQFCHSSQKKMIARNQELLERIQQFVETHIREEITLEQIAREVGRHPSSVSRFFKQQTGESIISYIKKRKMDLAKHLLESTSLSVEAVAQHVSYHTTHYFIRHFKEVYGMTPGMYRSAYFKSKPS